MICHVSTSAIVEELPIAPNQIAICCQEALGSVMGDLCWPETWLLGPPPLYSPFYKWAPAQVLMDDDCQNMRNTALSPVRQCWPLFTTTTVGPRGVSVPVPSGFWRPCVILAQCCDLACPIGLSLNRSCQQLHGNMSKLGGPSTFIAPQVCSCALHASPPHHSTLLW